MSGPPVTLLASIDVEEDNWQPAREGVRVENIRELPRLAGFFEKLGVRPTYFATPQVLARRWAAELVRAAADGGEVGAHLHPWNTPPFESGGVGPTMLLNYPYEQQLAKIRRLTQVVTSAVGARPLVFRAGRFGLGSSTVRALLESGYHADSSVTPYFSWEADDDGPDFTGAPTLIYPLGRESDPRVPDPEGRLLEVPISAGFTRFSPKHWPLCARLLVGSHLIRWSGLAGLAARTEFARRIILSPETNSPRQMLALSRRLIAAGTGQLHFFFHSSSLTPGLTPFARTPKDVERLYSRVEEYIAGLSREANLSFATVGETVARERAARGWDRSAEGGARAIR